jgi:hypothetical protein
LCGEAMITYIAKLLDITLNNIAIPGDWKKVIVFSFTKCEFDSYLETVDRSAYIGGSERNGTRYIRMPKTSLRNE